MKTLHFYLTRQLVASLGLTLAVFTFVLLLGNLLKEILELLVNRQATLLTLLQALAYLLPFVLVFALPMALLTSTLLVFGRFSADQELTAARVGGISLLALSGPILLLSVFLSGLSAWFNLQLGPQWRMAYKELLFRVGKERPTALLQENQFVRLAQHYIIYVGGVDGPDLRHLVVYQLETNPPPAVLDAPPTATGEAASTPPPAAPRVETIFSAPRASLTLDPTNQVLQLEMAEVEVVNVASWQPAYLRSMTLPLPVDLSRPRLGDPPLTDMTMGELLATYYEFRRLGVDITPVTVQMHRQVAFSFACVGFTLVGIPLAVRAHRRETSAGIGIALGLVVVYHAFVVLAQAWQTYPARYPHLILWVPNLLFHGLGAWLLWRANRRA
jgi:lipopolysaccharide export system permease protein